MFGLGKHGPDGRYGVILDIGSGSVGVAIVASDPQEEKPNCIWTHRERMVLRESDTLKEASKNIRTALLNSMLSVGNDGLKKLRDYDPKAAINSLQIAVSSPWSYTVTKTVTYKDDEPFTISKRLVEDLIATAKKQALEAIDEHGIIAKLGLESIAQATISLAANDYVMEEVFGQTAQKITVSHVNAIAQKKLLETVDEAASKVLPDIEMDRYSFMLIFYCVMRDLAPDTTEICLVDVTSEATEIGIVRDGVLRYVTHAQNGYYTIAREITRTTKIPTEEALAYIRGNVALESTLTPDTKLKLDNAIALYERDISDLFKRTGDALAIPRTVFLHTGSRSEAFFKERIRNASALATKSEHSIHLVTRKLLGDDEMADSALLLSARFFHNNLACPTFEQM